MLDSSTVKGLGEADEEESTAQWVIRMREIEKEKELAKKRVCVLSECCCSVTVCHCRLKYWKKWMKSLVSVTLLIRLSQRKDRFINSCSMQSLKFRCLLNILWYLLNIFATHC